MTRDRALRSLLRSREPSLRWKARVQVLGEDPASRSNRRLREEIRRSRRARLLHGEARRPGRSTSAGVYHKWLGPHWALASLADLGYPSGDVTLLPVLERAVGFWLRPGYYTEFVAGSRREGQALGWGVPRIEGRYRRCASQQGNALFYATQLGLAPEACERLAERLLHWQWPDGGWNCDLNPSADTSSFAETLTPMAGLFAHGVACGDRRALAAARRASEVFLRRRLFRRVSDGRSMRPEFVQLHYPLYWRYDVLGCLKVFARAGEVHDPRCSEALDLLETLESPAGGWGTRARFYDLPGETARRGTDRVRWGRVDGGVNPWVTADALWVLRAFGRYVPRP